MPFSELLEASVGTALVSFLNLKALLAFQEVAPKCSALVLLRLINRKAPLARQSHEQFQRLSDFGRYTTVMQGASELPAEVLNMVKRHRCVAPLFQPTFHGYHTKLSEEMYSCWDKLPNSKMGVFGCMVDFQSKNPDLACDLTEVRDWNKTRAFGRFVVLFDRPDGTIMVAEDMSAVYKVSCFQLPTVGQIANLRMVNGSWVKGRPYDTPIAHGPLLGTVVEMCLLNWAGRIVEDGIMRPMDNAAGATVKKALKAYAYAIDTNTLHSVLPMVIPDDAPAEPVQDIAAFRAKHAAAVQSIVSLPVTNLEQFHRVSLLRYLDRVDAPMGGEHGSTP